MSNIRRMIVVVLAAAVISLSSAGCKSGDKAAPAEQTKGEQPKREAPKGDHPKH